MANLTLVARQYHERLVPALFEPFAHQLLERMDITQAHRILDVACGTGVCGQLIREHVGGEAALVGVDLNRHMLAVAKEWHDSGRWEQASAEHLPFANDTFDVLVSQFGLMFFDDQIAALQEMHRVGAQGSQWGVSIFDDLNHNPVYAALADAFQSVAGREVGGALRFPFAMNRKRFGTLLNTASMPAEISRITLEISFPCLRDLILADVEGWFPFAGFTLSNDQIDQVTAAAVSKLESYTNTDGTIAFPVTALMAVGRFP